MLPPSLYLPALPVVGKVKSNKDLWWYLRRDGSILARIRDSKAVKEDDRVRLSAELGPLCSAYSIVHRGNDVIDAHGISAAFTDAVEEAVTDVLRSAPAMSGVTDAICMVDGAQRFNVCGMRTMSFPKGDTRSWTIAAASLLAKVERDAMMIEYHHCYDDRYSFDTNKGYGTAAHVEAIVEYGLCELHRRSFSAPLPGGGRTKLRELER
jgi:ribonuclease HII